jgi:hypothetical protein
MPTRLLLLYAWLDTAANGLSIFASHDIGTNGWLLSSNVTISSSDRRIKTNIVDADDVECLDVLRQLKPKKYTYKDT